MARLNPLVEVRPFIESDYEAVSSWFSNRGLPVPPRWSLSTDGWITPKVAAGFLYLTNSDIAFIDFFITSPEATIRQRARAIKEITRKIIATAHDEYGVQMICCNSKLRSIHRLAKQFGFTDTGSYMSFSKNL